MAVDSWTSEGAAIAEPRFGTHARETAGQVVQAALDAASSSLADDLAQDTPAANWFETASKQGATSTDRDRKDGSLSVAAERGTGVVAPKPSRVRREVGRGSAFLDAGAIVHLRFDVDREGKVSHVRVLDVERQSRETADVSHYVRLATELLESWPIEPGTLDNIPVAFQDIETRMVFHDPSSEASDNEVSGGDVVKAGVAFIILLPLAVVLSPGSMSFGN